jgi:hypothetical protein
MGAELRWSQQSGEEEEDDADVGTVGLPASGSWEAQYDIGSINGKALGAGERRN